MPDLPMTVLIGIYCLRVDVVGRLVEILRHKCENCGRKSLPLTISGKYLSGEPAVLHECSFCGYVRFHGQLGFKGVRKRKAEPLSKKANGRLSRYLRQMAEKLGR